MKKPLTADQITDALRLLYESQDVLCSHMTDGSYNNEDVIEMHDKIAKFFDGLK